MVRISYEQLPMSLHAVFRLRYLVLTGGVKLAQEQPSLNYHEMHFAVLYALNLLFFIQKCECGCLHVLGPCWRCVGSTVAAPSEYHSLLARHMHLVMIM